MSERDDTSQGGAAPDELLREARARMEAARPHMRGLLKFGPLQEEIDAPGGILIGRPDTSGPLELLLRVEDTLEWIEFAFDFPAIDKVVEALNLVRDAADSLNVAPRAESNPEPDPPAKAP